MHNTVIVLFSLLSIGLSKDITLGNVAGRKIFDEVRQANPAIWRQYENVTVIAPDNELISSVVITDMRPEKDGDVEIVSGGDGQKSVTIELKSPTVLRGYEFHIEVYSVPDTVATDAEEHLNNEDVTPEQNNVSTELPDSAPKNVDQLENNESVELPDDTNSKDIKEFPTLIPGDVTADRPARETEETEENNPQTDVPEDEVITSESNEYASESNESVSTTELPETPIEGTITDENSENIRPARETELHTSFIASAPPVTDTTAGEMTTEDPSETTVTDAAASLSDLNDVMTTETVVPPSSYDQATFMPVAYDNSKNIPDYASLNILDYIKNKESLRPIRHTEDENPDENVGTSELSVDIDQSTPIAEETSSIKPDDDTVDLVPPEIGASYNTDFNGLETTVDPIEGTTLNNVPRAGRGIDFDSDNENQSTPISINTDEEQTTTNPVNAETTTPTLDEDHTIASLDDQFRNTRGASTNLEHENDVSISEETPQEDHSGESSGEVDITQPNRNIIIVNLDEIMARDDKFKYAIPIVLVINSENNNYPIIKIIAENASDDRDKEAFPTLPSDESLEPSEFDYKIMENDRIKGDYMPSGDYDQNQ